MAISQKTGLSYQDNGVIPGGTTDQVLAKASNADYDLKWSTGGGGSGDVVGPASSTASGIAVYSNTTGKLLRNSTVTLDLLNNIANVNNLTSGPHTINTSVGNTGQTINIGGPPSFEFKSVTYGGFDYPVIGLSLIHILRCRRRG